MFPPYAHSLLFAFGIGNLAMLGWLAAAAAPLVIHLWNRRKYREMRWAAVDFLLAAMRRNARRIQLRQWLLLAVRTALILLVVLAMSEPYLERLGLAFTPGERTHKVLVIDGSYSMAYQPTDSTRFARAKQLARQIVEESPQGDGFTLVLMSEPPRAIVGNCAFEPHDFIEEIDNLQLPHTGGNVPATLAKVEEILHRAKQEHPGLVHHEVYFLTDLGATSWQPEKPEQIQTAAERLAEQASLVVLDLGQSGSENLAVTRLAAAESFATTSGDVTLQAAVQNFGRTPRSRHPVELFVDDSRVGEQFVDLEPNGQASVSFSHRFETPGPHVAEVRLGGDLLAVDNRRWLSLPVREHLRVLCVGGRQESTHFLTQALDPFQSERSIVRTQVVPESALMEIDLDSFDCIFLCNVGQFTASEARLLDAYLKQGGGLVIFLGDRVLADRYNRELAGDGPSGIRVLPARLGELVAEARYRFDPLDYRHPIVSAFRGQEGAGLLTTPVYRYFKLKPFEENEVDPARVALAFEGGDPAIVEQPIHRGRSVLVATAASPASIDPTTRTPWTTMPAWPSYVPLVQELLAAAVGSQWERDNALAGQSLGGPVDAASAGATLTMRTPGDRELPVRTSSDVGETSWEFSATDQSGVYTLDLAITGAPATPLAVNVDTTESDLTKIEPEALPLQFIVQTDWQNLDEPAAAEISRRSGLHKMLLYAAMVLLLAECWLASRWSNA